MNESLKKYSLTFTHLKMKMRNWGYGSVGEMFEVQRFGSLEPK